MLIIKTESYMFNQLAYPDVHERRTLQPLIDDCLKTIFNFYTIIKHYHSVTLQNLHTVVLQYEYPWLQITIPIGMNLVYFKRIYLRFH